MPLRFPARTKGTTTQTGSLTTFTIDEAYDAANPVDGWRSFTKAVAQGDLANGDTVPIIIVDTTVGYDVGSNLLQVCTATWNSATKQFTVTQNYQPAAGAPSWGSGRRDVVALDNPALFLLLAGGTLTGMLNVLISGTLITPFASTAVVVQRSISSGTDVGMSLVAGATGKSMLHLGNTGDEDEGGVYYNNSTKEVVFRANGADGSKMKSNGVLAKADGTEYLSSAAASPIPTGTVMVFYQAAAPAGWTKVTTQNDRALRVVSGTGGGSGGSRPLSSTDVGVTALTIAQMPSHSHNYNEAGYANFSTEGGALVVSSSPVGSSTSNVGGGDSHAHDLSLAYIDVIICSKN